MDAAKNILSGFGSLFSFNQLVHSDTITVISCATLVIIVAIIGFQAGLWMTVEKLLFPHNFDGSGCSNAQGCQAPMPSRGASLAGFNGIRTVHARPKVGMHKKAAHGFTAVDDNVVQALALTQAKTN